MESYSSVILILFLYHDLYLRHLLTIISIVILLLDLNYCRNHPCQHGGTCTNTIADQYKCSCTAGHTGINCETSNSYCQYSYCTRLRLHCFDRLLVLTILYVYIYHKILMNALLVHASMQMQLVLIRLMAISVIVHLIFLELIANKVRN